MSVWPDLRPPLRRAKLGGMRLRTFIPPAPFRGLLVQRAAVLWLVGRLMVAFFVLISPEFLAGNALHPGLPASLALAGLVAALTLLDVVRRHEAILLANLGVSRYGVAGWAAVPPLALEALICLAPV